MQKTNSFSYEQLEQVFDCDEKLNFPSELHGYICGIICGTRNTRNQDRFKLALNRLKEEDLFTKTNQKILAHLTIDTFKQLQDENYHLHLILPHDGTSFKSRLKALSKWCQGLLSGLGEAGLTQQDIDQKELQEALQDIFSITKVNYNSPDIITDSNNDELFYIELIEHIKVSMMLIYTENITCQK